MTLFSNKLFSNKLLSIIFIMIFLFFPVDAKMLPWHNPGFSLRAREMPLSQVLSNLAEYYGTTVNIDPKIHANFSGLIPPGPPLSTFNKLLSRYHLIFYFDGDTLYIYPVSQIKHQVMTLKTFPVLKLVQFLKDHCITEKKSCEIRRIPGINAIEVKGVPICIERVSQLASMLDGELTKRQEKEISMVIYPLKYATAVDDHYRYRDQDVVIPGVVSVLKSMNSDINQGQSTSSIQGLPMFAADPRQNAVIVRDYSTNIAGYQRLINALDQRPQMIEIAVMIIDVNIGDINKLGIDWNGTVSLGSNAFSFKKSNIGFTGGFSTVISNTNDFMLKLNALEQNAHAYVLSQPSVVTLNNIQAVLDKNITFYTKLQTDKFAKLESVTTGSLLRVTPRLMEESEGKKNIMLTLNIQDGQTTSPLIATEPLPQVQNSEIASQATLQPGQSLLLGGFKQDKQTQKENKVPLLGNIPVLGHLFKNRTDETHSVIRLFLIKASVAT